MNTGAIFAGIADLYRLIREKRIGNNGDPGVAYDKQYFYDPAGNRTRMIADSVQTDYAYDAANKMLAAGNATFTYDDAGNTLTQSEGGLITTYMWNYQGLMVRLTKTGETPIDFNYNADGMRVSKVVGNMVDEFVLDQNEIVEEITDGASRSFVGGPSFLIGEVNETAQMNPHPDGVGSTLNRPTMMVDPQGLFPGLTGCAIGAIGGGIGGIIGGGNWKEVACNAGLGCAAGGIAELLIEVFPVLGPSWAKCLLGAAAGGAGAAGGSGICNALFGDCPKEPFDWKCAAVSGLIGATTGCVGGFIDDDFWGVVLGVIGEAIGLDASSACSNDFPVPWFPKK